MRTDISNRDRLFLMLFGLPFLLAGLWVIAIGLHWIPGNSVKLHFPGWVLALFGLPFVGAGIAIMNIARSAETRTMAIMGVVMFVGIALVIHWIAFGSGPRQFTYEITKNHVVLESGPLDEASGRRMTAMLAIMLDLIFAAWVAWRVSNRHKPPQK